MPSPLVAISKRALDIASSLAGLALCAPLFPILAVAIKLDSPGPVLFAQERANGLETDPASPLGFRCRTFTLYKLRTMCDQAEAKTGAVLASRNDPRVTRVGRFLRKTRLDELPQLVNVLKGDMSLVGPRPERPELLVDLAAAIPFFEERVRGVKPGLTGPAQVSLRYTGAIPQDNPLWRFRESLQNPFGLDEAEGALADDMRAKLLYDMAYCGALERFGTFLHMELWVILTTPLVMIRKLGE